MNPLRAVRQVLPVIRHHHEKMAGSGYPYDVKANETPTVPQVTTVDVSLRSEQADETLIRQTYELRLKSRRSISMRSPASRGPQHCLADEPSGEANAVPRG